MGEKDVDFGLAAGPMQTSGLLQIQWLFKPGVQPYRQNALQSIGLYKMECEQQCELDFWENIALRN